jgi:hypothetical protein
LSFRVSLVPTVVAFLTIAWISTGLAEVEDIGPGSSEILDEGSEQLSNPTINIEQTAFVDSQIPGAVIDFERLDPSMSGYFVIDPNIDEAGDPSYQPSGASYSYLYGPVLFSTRSQIFLPDLRGITRQRPSCLAENTSIDIIRCEAREDLYLPSWALSQETGKDQYSSEKLSLAGAANDGARAIRAISIGSIDLSAAYYEIVFAQDSGIAPMFEFNNSGAKRFPGSFFDNADPLPGSFFDDAFAGPRVAGTIPEAPLPTMLLIGALGIALTRRKTKLHRTTAFRAGLSLLQFRFGLERTSDCAKGPV